MLTRVEILWNMVKKYHWEKRWKKLSAEEQKILVDFITKHEGDRKSDFEIAVNRLFLDKKEKPKNWTLVCEILCNVNSIFKWE